MTTLLDTLTIGTRYEIRDSPFTQVPQNFTGTYFGVANDIAVFVTDQGEQIKFTDWDLNEAMEEGEITIIER